MQSINCPLCGADTADLLWQEGSHDLVRCRACDLVFQPNPPDAEELSLLYSFEGGFHTELAGGSEHRNSATSEQALGHLALMDRVQRPGKLLDVGCATGIFMRHAKEHGWMVRGVEPNADTARIATEEGLNVTHGTLTDLESDELFDAITLWDVLEHVPNPLEVLREARQLLAPGGYLWVATPNVDGLFPSVSLKVADRVGRWPHPDLPHHICQFSESTLRQALARAGFHRVDVTHERIPLGYTFGSTRQLLTEPKRLAYTAVFAPIAMLGPAMSSGDSIVVCAQV